jgi:phage shock protein PspC (stress-responsive transcriptional regulator)
MNATSAQPEADHYTQAGPEYQPETQARPLRRPVEDRMLAGVAAGIARYLGIDATIVRIVLAVLAVAGGAGVPIYLAGWLLIPEEGCEQSIAGDFIQNRQARSR